MRGQGAIEARVAARAARGAIKSAILQTIAIGGIVSLAVMAPNVLSVLPRSVTRLLLDRSKSARNAAIGRLLKEGFLTREDFRGARVLRITKKGELYLARTIERKITPPRRWDKKWRIVTFDIREKRHSTRDMVRREMKSVGFIKLQNSVWVHPYPCEDFITLLKANARIGKEVLYIVAEEVENDAFLREKFKLEKK
jgi:CRISPR/Cas system-associated endoribonuclease Cas2